MATNPPTYADSVASLRTSLKFLDSSVETLDAGVSDFPRLINVLKTVRVRLLPNSSKSSVLSAALTSLPHSLSTAL